MSSSYTCITVYFGGPLTLRLAPKQGRGGGGGQSRVLCFEAVGMRVSSRACLYLLSGGAERAQLFQPFPLEGICT